jgi:hypothetical protein
LSLIEELKIHQKSNEDISDEKEEARVGVGGGEKEKSLSRRHYSSKLKAGKRGEKMALSRS